MENPPRVRRTARHQVQAPEQPVRRAPAPRIPPKKPKKKRWWIWVIVAVLGLAGLGNMGEKPPETQAVTLSATNVPTLSTQEPTPLPTAVSTQAPASTEAPTPAPTEIATQAPTVAPTAEPTKQATFSPAPTSQYKTLKVKAKGAEVQAMQDALVALGYLRKKDAIGEFGNNTLDAVKRFQKAHGLKGDGVAGSATLELLFGGNAVASGPVTYVWTAISGNGRKYHESSTCSSMKKAQEMSLDKAKELGFSPCDTCNPPR